MANSPTSGSELDSLVKHYPGISPTFVDLYHHMDGAKVFACELEDINPSILFFNIDEFRTENDMLGEWLEPYFDDEDGCEELQELDRHRDSIVLWYLQNLIIHQNDFTYLLKEDTKTTFFFFYLILAKKRL